MTSTVGAHEEGAVRSWQEAKAFVQRVTATTKLAAKAWQIPLPLWRIAA